MPKSVPNIVEHSNFRIREFVEIIRINVPIHQSDTVLIAVGQKLAPPIGLDRRNLTFNEPVRG